MKKIEDCIFNMMAGILLDMAKNDKEKAIDFINAIDNVELHKKSKRAKLTKADKKFADDLLNALNN